jgi:hypothetical protein
MITSITVSYFCDQDVTLSKRQPWAESTIISGLYHTTLTILRNTCNIVYSLVALRTGMDASDFPGAPMHRRKTRRTGSDSLDASVGWDCFEPPQSTAASLTFRGDPLPRAMNLKGIPLYARPAASGISCVADLSRQHAANRLSVQTISLAGSARRAAKRCGGWRSRPAR